MFLILANPPNVKSLDNTKKPKLNSSQNNIDQNNWSPLNYFFNSQHPVIGRMTLTKGTRAVAANEQCVPSHSGILPGMDDKYAQFVLKSEIYIVK